MNKDFTRFRTLSMRAYILFFGAIYGYTIYGYTIYGYATLSVDRVLLSICVLMALVGTILVGIKNWKFPRPQVKPRIMLADILVTIVLLVLSIVLPNFLGAVKGIIVVLVASIYIFIYFRLLDQGKLVGKEI